MPPINGKRIILLASRQPGVGKKTFLHFLADWYEQNEINFAILPENNEVHHILDAITNQQPPVIIITVSQEHGDTVNQWIAHINEVKGKVKITLIGFVNEDPESIQELSQWPTSNGIPVDYLVVRNQRNSIKQKFDYWSKSPEAAHIKTNCNPKVIDMDHINRKLRNLLSRSKINMRQVVDGKVKGFLAHSRWKIRCSWHLQRVKDQLCQNREVLTP